MSSASCTAHIIAGNFTGIYSQHQLSFYPRNRSRRRGRVTGDWNVTTQDYCNLVLIGITIGTVLVSLLQGASPAGSALVALAVLILLSPINHEIRANPMKLAKGFAEGGMTFAKLFMAVGTIGVVVGALASTGLPMRLALTLDQFVGETLLQTLVVGPLPVSSWAWGCRRCQLT